MAEIVKYRRWRPGRSQKAKHLARNGSHDTFEEVVRTLEIHAQFARPPASLRDTRPQIVSLSMRELSHDDRTPAIKFELPNELRTF